MSRTRASVSASISDLAALPAGVHVRYTRGAALARGLNLNAPVNGVRPDPAFANVIEVVATPASRQHQLQINLTANPRRCFRLRRSRAAL